MIGLQTADLIRGAFEVSNGRCLRYHTKHTASNVAEAAANDCRDTVCVYLDSLGFLVARKGFMHRDDATLVREFSAV